MSTKNSDIRPGGFLRYRGSPKDGIWYVRDRGVPGDTAEAPHLLPEPYKGATEAHRAAARMNRAWEASCGAEARRREYEARYREVIVDGSCLGCGWPEAECDCCLASE